MLKHMRNNLGYTLIEIVTTTAIIGSLTAVAVPNFLRVKMNVNMEMVKQHLKVIGQEMNELYNEANPHEFPADILTLDPAEELAITASLNSIDNKGYTIDGYLPGANRSTYTFRTCPKEGLFNIAGDRCFLLDPMGIRELMPWDGDGVAMAVFSGNAFAGTGGVSSSLALHLSNPTLSKDEKIQIVALFLEAYSFLTLHQYLGAVDGLSTQPQEIPAILFEFLGTISASAETNQNTFKTILPEVYETLKDRGVTLFNKNITVESDGIWNGDPLYYWKDPSKGFLSMSGTNCGSRCAEQGSYLQMGFKFEDSLKDKKTASARFMEAAGRLVLLCREIAGN